MLSLDNFKVKLRDKSEDATSLILKYKANKDNNHFKFLWNPKLKPIIYCDIQTNPPPSTTNHKHSHNASVNEKVEKLPFWLIVDIGHILSFNDTAWISIMRISIF